MADGTNVTLFKWQLEPTLTTRSE